MLAGITAVIIFFIVWFFLIPHPEMVGIHVEEMTEKEALIASVQEKEIFENVIRPSRASLASPEEVVQKVRLSQEFRRLSSAVMEPVKEAEKHESISFWKAWLLPRVILYSSALFLTKMAVYNLLLQLPTFLKKDPHFNPPYSEQDTANLSTVIDVGAMLGSIFLGKLSDFLYGKRSPIALGALLISSAVSFTLYSQVFNMTTLTLFIMFFMIGFFLSGLNNMI